MARKNEEIEDEEDVEEDEKPKRKSSTKRG